jgi:hypothetical protein
MEGGKLLVTGSSVGLLNEKEARTQAVKDAAHAAAEYIQGKGLGKATEIRQAVEESVLRETPLQFQDWGEAKLENVCQERWSSDHGQDHWSIHLVLSLRLGPKKTGK